ncbi:hypothetical protein SAMN04488490_1809 [Marinobacter sp. LV10R510-11A]|nr:hypothetical protein SAMN04488490_1809 [Marinobacter sp. LV10R510-11A]
MSKTRVVIASKITMAHAISQAMAMPEAHTLFEPESHTALSRGKGKKRKQWEKQK